MGDQSLFDPNREIEPEAPRSEDKRVGVFVLVVLALLIALLLALVAYYFLVIRPFMVMANPHPVVVAGFSETTPGREIGRLFTRQ
jgi:hypothetical protein